SKCKIIISRGLESLKTAVITTGQFNAGKSFNVIAEQAELVGTVRYLDKDIQQQVKSKMKQIVEGICQASGAEADFRYYEGYPPVINHSKETKMIFIAAKNISEDTGTIDAAPQMGGEDFAFFLEIKPGSFLFSGAYIPEYTYT